MNAGFDDQLDGPLWPSDVTPLCERVARRKARAGAPHPVAAALSICARAHTRLTPTAFAARVGLTRAQVDQLESGRIPWRDIPDGIALAAADAPGLDLLALADLDARLADSGGAVRA